jgi:2',3'-cyclic-nucleotide 2'-phosphodiesterase (5'-nucleotidase family)
VQSERAKALPVVLMDAGNALFRAPGRTGGSLLKQRAELVLEQMEALGTVAMAVGERDLALGLSFLQKATRGKKRKLQLLSANLVDKAGKAPFAATTVVEAGGLKVGVVGVSPEGKPAGAPGLTGKPPVEAALAEARKLREQKKVDVVVVLAAVPYPEAEQIARLANEAVDFVVQSHENKGTGTGERVGSHAPLFPAGERGRQVARLELTVEGPGPSVDLGPALRARSQLHVATGNLQRARERLASATDEATRRSLQSTLQSFERHKRELEAQAQVVAPQGGRAHHLSYLHLGNEVKDDPALKQRVEKLEPPGSAPH